MDVATYECPYCDKDGLTMRERSRHAENEHDEHPFAQYFPAYYVCEHEESPLYLKMESPGGRAIIGWDNQDHFDEVEMHELLRHDWELATKEDTPFGE